MIALNIRNVSSFHLKLIALITMLIDHLADAFLAPLIIASKDFSLATSFYSALMLWVNGHREALIDVYYAMRTVGRIAFPIYCFLLVQGFIHTRNLRKYSLRLFIFAIISEVPFDLAFHSTFFAPLSNNVFITLFICLMMLWAMTHTAKLCRALYEKHGKKLLPVCIYVFALAFLLCAQYALQVKFLHSDYGIAAPAVIFIMYYLRKYPAVSYLFGTLALIAINSSAITFMALVGLVPLLLYNGTRGRPMKYLFYVFYPLHLVILFAMRLIFRL